MSQMYWIIIIFFISLLFICKYLIIFPLVVQVYMIVHFTFFNIKIKIVILI